jgi:ABC-type nitrate/sulfonate/bicarbonate transport system substrate-binding protein
MKKKPIIVTVFLILLLILVQIIFFSFNGNSELEKVSLRHSWIIDANTAGYIAAIEKGFYKDEGLDVTINSGGVDANPITMVASGSDTFGNIAGSEEILMARDKGIPIKAVFATHQNNAYVFITKKDSGINSPNDFEGKKVFVQYGKGSEILYRALIKKLNVDTSKIEEVPLKFDYSEFLEDRVPIAPAFINNQVVIFENQGVDLNIFYPKDYGITSYGYLIITKDSTIKNNPELVQKFVRATTKGWEYALENKEEAVDFVLKYNSELDRDLQMRVFDSAIQNMITSNEKVGTMKKERWETTQNILLDQNLISSKFPIEEVYTTEFLEDLT